MTMPLIAAVAGADGRIVVACLRDRKLYVVFRNDEGQHSL
jgi:hypothetical protein